MSWIQENIWLLLLLIWGLPLMYFRSAFRKLVYETDHWNINVKPLFWKELKGLFGNLRPKDPQYIKTRNLYRVYLLIYLVLIFFYSSS